MTKTSTYTQLNSTTACPHGTNDEWQLHMTKRGH